MDLPGDRMSCTITHRSIGTVRWAQELVTGTFGRPGWPGPAQGGSWRHAPRRAA
jgi:hypothetical protein